MSEIYDMSLRLLRARSKDVRTSDCHLARGVWPGLGTVSPDVTLRNLQRMEL